MIIYLLQKLLNVPAIRNLGRRDYFAPTEIEKFRRIITVTLLTHALRGRATPLHERACGSGKVSRAMVILWDADHGYGIARPWKDNNATVHAFFTRADLPYGQQQILAEGRIIRYRLTWPENTSTEKVAHGSGVEVEQDFAPLMPFTASDRRNWESEQRAEARALRINVHIGHNEETSIVVSSDEEDMSNSLMPARPSAGELSPVPSAAATADNTVAPPSGQEAAQQSNQETAVTSTDCIMDDATCGAGEQ